MKIKLQIALIPMLLLPASFAHAENEPDHVSESNAPSFSPASDHDFRFDVASGVFATPGDGGVTLGGDVLRRNGLFEYGLDGSYGSTLFSYSYGQVSGAAGLAWQTRSGLRLEALGEFGATYYTGVGKAFLSDNPGISGITPTLGAKGGVSYLFAPNAKGHFSVGLWFYGDDDLTRETKSVSFDSSGFTADSPHTSTSDTLGTTRIGAMISLGGVLPF